MAEPKAKFRHTRQQKVMLWCRDAWESSGEVRDQVSKQRQMMADGNLRGFWSKQGRFRLKKYAHTPCFYMCLLLVS